MAVFAECKRVLAGVALVIYYFKHGLAAAYRVLLFVAVVFMSAVACFIVADNFSTAFFTSECRHLCSHPFTTNALTWGINSFHLKCLNSLNGKNAVGVAFDQNQR
ncbi:MAG: hypothetical protein QXL10_05350 [Candidatus Bathyarchaeia archaeon]